jgi:glycosyltransferase involved in cell wall biosynthesis
MLTPIEPQPQVISLVMTVYNSQTYLALAIDSILAQTYPHWHLLIWDDGSTDTSAAIATHYADCDPRIQVLLAPHQGRVPALADAIAATSPHPYLAFIDSDDYLAPNALSATLEILEQQPTVGVVYSDYLTVDAQGQTIGLGSRCSIPYSPHRLLVDFMCFPFRLLRRSVYEQVGGIDRQFQAAEDYDLCLKLSEITEFYHLALPLYYYREHPQSISKSQHNQQTEYSAQAVQQALVRRKLTDKYQFSITPAGQFSLRANTQSQPTEPPANIPKIIHQTWKDDQLPPQLAAFQQTWREHHPDWEHRLWTDADNRAFLAEHYAWFLPIYDGYPQPIYRVDAVRYFWLHHFGGVYIDLDFECLAPIDSLIAEQSLVLSLEPAAHCIENHQARAHRLQQILSPAWMASAPQHPFWPHLWQHLATYQQASNPLEATGPFLLTRAYENYALAADITMVAPEQLHPLTLNEIYAGQWLDLARRQPVIDRAVAVHHWLGSWWKPNRANTQADPLASLAAVVLEKGQEIFTAQFNYLAYQAQAKDSAWPRISCLMVTKDRTKLARRAIFCFLQQTYTDKELVIIDDGTSTELAEFVQRLDTDQVRYYPSTTPNLSLGELRNLARTKMTGTYLCQWDDDDLCDPLRLGLQMAVIQALQVDACLLDSINIWWPQQQRLAKSFRRLWAGTILCHRDVFPAYPHQQRGEDTEVVQSLLPQQRLAALHHPDLYLYCFHQNNTCDAQHFDRHWRSAQAQWLGNDYIVAMQKLVQRLPIYPYLQLLQAPTIPATPPTPVIVPEPVNNSSTPPVVSCLMVTKNRDQLARISIDCFLRQTYTHKELIIIDDGESDQLAQFVQGLNHPQIFYHRLPNENLTLGELRNLSIARATGQYLAQWNDDDLNHPDRLAAQMAAIKSLQTDGCFLNTVYIWWPHQHRLAKSCQRVWEGTLVCRKDRFPAYPTMRRGEDTPVVQAILQTCRIAAMERPWLYLYNIHQQNTWPTQHFEAHWQAAQVKLEADDYTNLLSQLSEQMPIANYLQATQLQLC